jgi:3-deoxy-D-manno-octulosonic-acid transferase
MLVNGRVSPRTFKGYRRLRPLARELFQGFNRVLVQTEVDYQRLYAVGVEAGRLEVGGNLKFDSAPAELEEKERGLLAQELGLSGCKVLVAGSTHPGEEEPCLEAFAALHQDHPDLALLLAPREVSRGRSLAQMAARRGLRVFQASQGSPPPGVQVLVLDVLGKLAQAYALGVAAFVGGSLVPVGGHNLLEPAAQGVPVLFGPHTHNFLTMAQSLEAVGGGIRISRGRELKPAWGDFLSQPEKTRQVGLAAKGFCQAHRGAVDRAVAEAQALLESV